MIDYKTMTLLGCKEYLKELKTLYSHKKNSDDWLEDVEIFFGITLKSSYLDDYDNVVYPNCCFAEATNLVNNEIKEVEEWLSTY